MKQAIFCFVFVLSMPNYADDAASTARKEANSIPIPTSASARTTDDTTFITDKPAAKDIKIDPTAYPVSKPVAAVQPQNAYNRTVKSYTDKQAECDRIQAEGGNYYSIDLPRRSPTNASLMQGDEAQMALLRNGCH
jgi:hypothetical protein